MPNTSPSFNFGRGWIAADTETVDLAIGMAVQPDGRILLAGVYAVVRINTDGTLDAGFGDSGRVYLPSFDGAAFIGTEIALATDGTFVVAGYSLLSTGFDRVLARYNADGTLDATFGTGGKVVTDFGSNEEHRGVVIQSDGKIVAIGNSLAFDFEVSRYNADGTLDASFGIGGFSRVDLGGQDFAWGVDLQLDGKIVVIGSSFSGVTSFGLARFNTNGTLDASFDGDGTVLTDLVSYTSTGQNVAIQPDGKILAAGQVSSMDGSVQGYTIVRYNVDGSVDATFPIIEGFFGGHPEADVALLPNGKVLLSATAADAAGASTGFLLARYNADGTLDTGFGANGVATAPLNGGELALSVAVQTNGKLLVAGETANNNGGGERDLGLVRFNSDGTVDLGPNVPHYVENGPPVRLDSGVMVFDAELSAIGNYGEAFLTISRDSGSHPEDTFSASGILGPLTEGSDLVYGGTIVGTVVQNSNGRLRLDFNDAATQVRVNGVLQSIAYSNTDAVPPPSAAFRWVFADGNTGDQGDNGNRSGVHATVVLIDPSNDAPGFSAGPNEILAVNTPARTVVDWATGLSAGPSDETGQTLDFIVVNDNAALFSTAPSIAPDGTLTYAIAAGAAGVAHVTVRLHDNGGTANGGVDTSAPQMFDIEAVAGSVLNGRPNADNIIGGPASEILNGLGGNDSLEGGGGSDNMIGGNGDDLLIGGAGGDLLNGGADFDYASYSTAGAGILANLTGPSHNTGDAAGDGFISIEGLIGTQFNDTLAGDNNPNVLQGLGGNDYLQAGGGTDALQGGNGNDQLEGGAGNDALDGGSGFDYARYCYSTAAVTVDLATPGDNQGDAGGDSYVSIEGLAGSQFDDVLSGDNGVNDLAGVGGIDQIDGREGNDNLQGMDGDDTLDGGAGADRLVGGAGNDTFVFKRGEANGDTLADFNGNGALAGDSLLFQGYGSAPGATFLPIDATHWRIRSSDGLVQETINVPNGALIVPTDFAFV